MAFLLIPGLAGWLGDWTAGRLNDCDAGWLALASSSPPFLALPSSLFLPLFILCAILPILSPAWLLAIQLLLSPIRCFRQAR